MTQRKFTKREYKKLLQEEISEWKRMEKESLKAGIPWWVDLRKAKVKGKNLYWVNHPQKEKIIRGKEKELLIKLASKAGKKALDLGCGSGWLSLELARKGMDVIGVDVSQDRINTAKKFLKQNPYQKNFGSLKYLVADLNELDFPPGSFDVLVAWDTLHHFPELENILRKSSNWLKNKGKFITFDHLGNRLLKLGTNIQVLLSDPNKKPKIIPYEDTLGKEMITIIKKYFKVEKFTTRLCLPISAALYLFLSKDIFIPLLPLVVKIDRILCNSKIFTGEYFFLSGEKK